MSGHRHLGSTKCSCTCEHDPRDELDEKGSLYSLYQKIDTLNVQCLNEAVEDSGKLVFKPWEDKNNREKFVESDVDHELLFNIPFTANVRIKGIIVMGGEEGQHPKSMKLFKNRPNMTFDDGQGEADQEFELIRDNEGEVEYDIKVTRFSSCHHLSIYFNQNFSADTTKVYYIGLRGDFTEFQRQEIALATYETRANPADHHKVNMFDDVPRAVQ